MAQQVEVNFDAETLVLLKRVLVEAEQSIPTAWRTSEMRVRLASAILEAARNGERNPGRLRSAGLRGIDPRLLPARKREISEMLMKKTLVCVLVAATIAATLAATTSDASAQWGRRWGPGGGWRGPGVGAGIAAGVVGGAIVAGAILASRPAGYVVYPGYAQPVSGPGCYWASQPVLDPYGRVVGYTGRPVQVCPGYVASAPPPPPPAAYAAPPPVTLPPK